MNSKIKELLNKLTHPEENYSGNWFENSQESVGILQDNWRSSDIILYASSFPTVSINSVLVPSKEIKKIGAKALGNVRLDTSKSWNIDYSYNGKEINDLNLNPPLSGTITKNGEQLIFKRNFSYVKEFLPRFEISQKLIHSLGLHFMEEYHAYCRLGHQGDIEEVISIYDNKKTEYFKNLSIVTIRKSALERYMVMCEMSLVTRFNFHRQYALGVKLAGSQLKTDEIENTGLYCKSEIIPGLASYSFGCLIYHTSITKANLIRKLKAEEDTRNKKYATFIIYDWKNSRIIEELSCGPGHTANYFTKSDLPFEISPAFFRPEVLLKYKSDSEKYTITDRVIYCRGTWHLKTYDINEEGQVFTYLKYLADLPYEEQLYWKSFNEIPEGGISKQAYETDFLGKSPTDENPLRELKKLVKQLNQESPKWWSTRDSKLIRKVLYPSSNTEKEWGDMILALDQLIVEGFREKGLKSVIDEKGGEYESCWKSLKLLEVTLEHYDQTKEEAKCLVTPLKELYSLRSKMIAHSNPLKKHMTVSEARGKHGSLSNHFKYLVQQVHCSTKNIVELISSKNE